MKNKKRNNLILSIFLIILLLGVLYANFKLLQKNNSIVPSQGSDEIYVSEKNNLSFKLLGISNQISDEEMNVQLQIEGASEPIIISTKGEFYNPARSFEENFKKEYGENFSMKSFKKVSGFDKYYFYNNDEIITILYSKYIGDNGYFLTMTSADEKNIPYMERISASLKYTGE